MAATKEDIRLWIERGIELNATHVVVVCDTFDWDDYPVMVSESEDVKEVIKKYDGPNMQKVMEVYNLHKDIETQLNERRSYNL